MKIRESVRSFLLSPKEITCLAFADCYIDPIGNLFHMSGEPWDSSSENIDNLFWGQGRLRLGWIQNISVDAQNKLLKVGHFAVEKDYVGMGLGARLARSFGREVKSSLGVTHICFDESSQDPAYPHFFSVGLGATQQSSPAGHGKSWLWQIS